MPQKAAQSTDGKATLTRVRILAIEKYFFMIDRRNRKKIPQKKYKQKQKQERKIFVRKYESRRWMQMPLRPDFLNLLFSASTDKSLLLRDEFLMIEKQIYFNPAIVHGSCSRSVCVSLFDSLKVQFHSKSLSPLFARYLRQQQKGTKWTHSLAIFLPS